MSKAQAIVVDNGELHTKEIDFPDPKEQEILIEVKYAGINRIDIFMAQGKMGPVNVVGVEVSGVISKLGPGCKSNFKPGDKVCCLLNEGGYAEKCIAHEDLIIPLPKTLSLKEGASIPENWATAYQLLFYEAQITKDDIILVHAAGSGVAVALIQLAVSYGATVVATAGSQEKLDHATSLGASAAFNYKTGFADKVMQFTESKGVSVILDCVGASHAEQNMQVIRTDGRWVLYGLLSGNIVPDTFLPTILHKRLTLRGTTLRSRSLEYKGRLIKDFVNIFGDKFDNGELKVHVSKTFPMKDVKEAHNHMSQNINIGKLLLSME